MVTRQVNIGESPHIPLAPWTYSNTEVFDLEYEAFFLRRWQFVGHISQVKEPGDYMTARIGRDSVIVIRDKDDSLNAFLNVCRHRGTRLLEGNGSCQGVIKCPYHGWAYNFDGQLLGVPQEDNFPDFDRSNYGLHRIQLEIFHGFVFVKVQGDGESLVEMFAHTADYFQMYDVENYVVCAKESTQLWEANWKVAWDNYLENYHIPVAHPSLNRLLVDLVDEAEELTSGVSVGVFSVKDKLSSVSAERRYQEQLHVAAQRIPRQLRGKWVQFGVSGNLGIDLYPEFLDIFQLIPLSSEQTLVRTVYYGHQTPTLEEEQLRRLNIEVNEPVNEEDRLLCERVQKGLKSTGYSAGPFSREEEGLYHFHDLVRQLVPVTSLPQAPAEGSIKLSNDRLASEG